MTNPQAVRLGLRRRDRSRPVIRLPLRGVPVYPASADHLSQVPAWNGKTNFSYGTCGPVTCANSAIMTWKYLLGQDITVTDDAVFDLYRRSGNPDFNPATGQGDNGVDMTVMLSALRSGGLEVTHADNSREIIRPVCFAEAAPEDIDSIRAVTAICGGVALAWDLDVAQQSQKIWDYVPGSGPWGGHATFGGAFTSLPAGDEAVISWQAKYETTDSFTAHQLSGVFVIVWEPLWAHPAFQDGVDQAALAADYQSLTGQVIPAPVPPAPEPVPGPVPVPDALDTALASPETLTWAHARHIGATKRVAAALVTWANGKGLSQ